eukprot:COSAG06_NODE_78_length_25492_cov_189.998307_18_plen_351_part_00
MKDIELPASGGLSFLKVGPSGDNIRSYTSCCGTLFNSAGGGNWAGGDFPARPLTRNNIKTADGGAYTPADVVTDVVVGGEGSNFTDYTLPEPHFFGGSPELGAGFGKCGAADKPENADAAWLKTSADVTEVVPITWEGAAEEGVPPPSIVDAAFAEGAKFLTPSPLRDDPAEFKAPEAVPNVYEAAATGPLVQPSLFDDAPAGARAAQSVRQVTLTGQEVVVGATRDYVEYHFEVTGTDAGDETFTSRFSHAKSVHDQLYEEGALDRFADAGLSFPSHSLDALRDMTHDEENVKRRGGELEAYYTELFQKHGVAIGHKAFLPNFRRAMDMAKAKDQPEPEPEPEHESRPS